MSWDVETTSEFDEWFATLSGQEEEQVVSAIAVLEVEGPNLGRPLVDTVKASRRPNMKELRRRSFRILFAFDPERVAVLLIGGNKEGQWNRWYKRAIKQADRLFDAHLRRGRR